LEPITGFDLDEPIHNGIVHCTSQNRASKFHRAGRDWLPVLATMLSHLAKDGRQATWGESLQPLVTLITGFR
jgi:hypothetical protein